MIKIKMMFVSLLMVSLLVACGSKTETVTICEGDLAGLPGATGTAEYTAKGDSITAYRTVQNIPYASVGLEKEEAEIAFKEAHDSFDVTDNVESDYVYNEDSVTITITLKDIAKATAEELEVAGLSVSPGVTISLEKTVELQEQSTDMVCTLQGE